MLRYRLLPAPGARIMPDGARRIVAAGARGVAGCEIEHQSIRQTLLNLERENISELELIAFATMNGGEPLAAHVRSTLETLKRAQALSFEVDGVARLLPLTARTFADRPLGADPAQSRIDLGVHTYFQPAETGLRILAPVADAIVEVRAPLAAHFVAASCGGGTSPPHVSRAMFLLKEVLEDTGHLRPANPALFSPWSFADQVFHSASRLARVWGPFGKSPATIQPVPSRPAGTRFNLPAPARPAPAIIQKRRSIRRPGPTPLTIGQLATLLHYAAGRLPGSTSHAFPSPGGIYDWTIYIAAGRCTGLPTGLYRYSTGTHQLEDQRASPAPILNHAAGAIGLHHGLRPDVLLVLTAGYPSYASGYQAIAYRLLLLAAGCLIENFYLAAAELGLAGCAVGAGAPLEFAGASNTHPWVEPSLAEFALSGGSGESALPFDRP